MALRARLLAAVTKNNRAHHHDSLVENNSEEDSRCDSKGSTIPCASEAKLLFHEDSSDLLLLESDSNKLLSHMDPRSCLTLESQVFSICSLGELSDLLDLESVQLTIKSTELTKSVGFEMSDNDRPTSTYSPRLLSPPTDQTASTDSKDGAACNLARVSWDHRSKSIPGSVSRSRFRQTGLTVKSTEWRNSTAFEMSDNDRSTSTCSTRLLLPPTDLTTSTDSKDDATCGLPRLPLDQRPGSRYLEARLGVMDRWDGPRSNSSFSKYRPGLATIEETRGSSGVQAPYSTF